MSVLDDDIRALLREALRDEPAPLTALELSHRSTDTAWSTDTGPRRLPQLRRSRRWVAPVLALAAIAVVVVGLIAIGTNRNQSVGNNPARWHWLLRDVPPGWKPTSVFDSTTDPPRGSSSDGFVRNFYATDAEPLGPSLIVESSTDPSQSSEIGSSYSPNALSYEEFDLDGKRAAFAMLPDDAKGLYVEINAAWVYLWSRGLSDESLRTLGGTLTADATGHYDVAGSALPDGMHKVDLTTIQNPDYVSIDYSPSSGDGSGMHFSIGPAAPTPIGRGAMPYEFKAVATGDFSGFLGSVTTGNAAPLTTQWLVLWRHDGLDFLISGSGVTSDQILSAATSASRASPDEWAHLLGSKNIASSDTVPTGTAPPVAPVDTEPSFVGEPRDVAITVTVDDVSKTEQRWSGVLPTGESWSAKITRVYDHIEMRAYSNDGTVLESLSASTAQATGDGQVTCCGPMAITKNPNAAALRVLLSNGNRYTIPLHELPGNDGVRTAFIPIPDLASLTELVDATGNVLQSYTPH